jgi:anti-anti-sigma regulatory factor
MTRAAVRTRSYAHTTVIVLCGDIVESDLPDLCRSLADAIVRRRPRRVVVDLSRATALDPTAIGALVAAGDTAPDLHVVLGVRSPDPAVTADLAALGLLVLAGTRG